jgi:hypothetical protein
MPTFLLIGAGFSRNWGGWLAGEAFEYLLGCQEIQRDQQLRNLLWKHQPTGGFEDALAELQAAFTRDPHGAEPLVRAFQAAVIRMFDDMNRAFFEVTDWEFQNFRQRQVGYFLPRFDAIFSLNQDLLLEHYYVNRHTAALADVRRWAGSQLPGMRRIPAPDPALAGSAAHSTWTPLPDANFTFDPNQQPIFKLHGSSNWEDPAGNRMLIMGGAKAVGIGQQPILLWYAQQFEERLSQPGARLMVIGYGFRDQHINEIIKRAAERGLRMFLVAPEGAEIARRLNPTNQATIRVPSDLEGLLQQTLIGASRRPLRDIFGGDTAEHNKVMRFFDR